MKKSLKIVTSIFVVLLLSACGKPTMDGASEEALEASLVAITKRMPEEEANQFIQDVRDYTKLGRFAGRVDGLSKSESDAVIFPTLDGKTVDEFYQMVDEKKEYHEEMNKP
jgi:outer membrane biogenesis lipoprotein LolB